MHRDHKLALALALLLIGVAAALCFPKQQPNGLADLELDRADQIDAAIDRLPVRVYTEPHDPGGETEPPATDPRPADVKPELRDPFAEFALLPAAPDPIPLADVSRPAQDRAQPPSRVIDAAARSDSGTADNTVTPPAAPVDATDEPVVYVVQPGDTLSGLAVRFLGSTRRYLELYEANRDVLSSPDDLQVGMRLRIPQTHGANVRATTAADPESVLSGGSSRSDTPPGFDSRRRLFTPH